MALQEKHREQVVCVSFNTNYYGTADAPPESFRAEVTKFLTAQNARMENVISSDADEELYLRLKLAGPPAVYVYDRTGELRKRFDNETNDGAEFTYNGDVEPFVAQLLTE